MRTLLKVHEDIHTVPEAIGKMMEEYAAEGYQVERLSSMNFKITLQGGWVHIYWQDGRIWQEIMEETADNRGQESMDRLSVWFCDKLHAVNGFVVEVAAGHIISIRREAGTTGMPPSIGHTAGRATHMPTAYR